LTAEVQSNQELAAGSPTPLEEFSSRFGKQAGLIYFAKSPTDLISIANDLILQRGKGESCCAPIALSQGENYIDITKELRSTIPFEDFHKNPKEITARIDVGITKATYAIAETGSIVDISFTDEHRLLSSFSRVHIAVLDRSTVLKKLSELAPKIRELTSRGANEIRPSITLIGGPSRTSDIELKSVLGVHGPHEVHVLVL
jgi:L-lactate utilization protein LutC